MYNPYALKPGEHLTRQQLFNRYIDWRVFNITNKVLDPGAKCDTLLYPGLLCCEYHMRIPAEENQFMLYFSLLGLTKNIESAFSTSVLKEMIVNNHLSFNSA
ncbi:MAG: hypothetical protein UW35_C0043G0010 [Candidatus Collierbacteria bacterium GW2011_GWF2_44_15]|uniref:Uncharacterized protein n=1 Tax=Candidatus Collierbacteria bacterium GW2011_GWF2_44_15 TaxID=1618404 RepID=A0A0G1HCL3_9BACT|nr:MAG: hypothetical protein UW35_C0043G0010 [Candidatus Collierbacteria bacterium GW2011_GWF2_44_15]